MRTTPVSATTASQAGAWSLPEPSLLIEQVLSRIVAQDKPGAVAMNSYARRFVGRAETVDAVRRFTGHSVDLAPSAFSAVSGWTDARALVLPACEGPDCPPPENSVWLAVTRIERGEVAREVFVWYTTNFAAYSEAGAQKQKYAFCERWVRAGGRWSYEGFIRVSSGGD